MPETKLQERIIKKHITVRKRKKTERNTIYKAVAR